jgi:hypothetical protein
MRPAFAALQEGRPEAASETFRHSPAKLRIACALLMMVAIPGVPATLTGAEVLQWIAIAWLVIIAGLSELLAGRARNMAAVLRVDACGAVDDRIGLTLRWQEISRVFPVNVERAQVVDIELRWPGSADNVSWQQRVGCWCQRGFAVPAATISMLLLDGGVGQFLAAMARHRLDLLDVSNRPDQVQRSAWSKGSKVCVVPPAKPNSLRQRSP